MKGKGNKPHWTAEQVADLRRLWSEERPAKEIGRAVGRSERAVFLKALSLCLPRRTSEAERRAAAKRAARVKVKDHRKTRPCLGCGQPFKSEGAHNWMCELCKRQAAEIADLEPAGAWV